MRIKTYLGDNGGSGYYRATLPTEKMQKVGVDAVTATKFEMEDILGKRYPKIFIRILQFLYRIFRVKEQFRPDREVYAYQRVIDSTSIKNAQWQRSRGAKTVLDIDDWLFDIDRASPCYNFFMDPKNQSNLSVMMQTVSAITVSTDFLRNKCLPFNANVKVLPNSLNFTVWDHWFTKRQPMRDGKIRLGWHGSATHFSDLMLVKDLLITLLRTYDNLVLVFVGFEFHIAMKKDFEPFWDRIEFRPFVRQVEAFQQNILDFDIGIAPLVDNHFNKAKSNIKFLEYSAMGIPTVASNVEPYKIIEEGITGYLVSPKHIYSEFLKKLKLLIENPGVRERIGTNARDFVKKHFDIEKNVGMWIKFYEELAEVKETQDEIVQGLSADPLMGVSTKVDNLVLAEMLLAKLKGENARKSEAV